MKQEEEFLSLISLGSSFNTGLIIHRLGPGSRIPPSQQSTLSNRLALLFSSLWWTSWSLQAANKWWHKQETTPGHPVLHREEGHRGESKRRIWFLPPPQRLRRQSPRLPHSDKHSNLKAFPLVALWKRSYPLAFAHFKEDAGLWVMAR